MSEDGLLLRAWAPGRWDTVQCVEGMPPRLTDEASSAEGADSLLLGFPGS